MICLPSLCAVPASCMRMGDTSTSAAQICQKHHCKNSKGFPMEMSLSSCAWWLHGTYTFYRPLILEPCLMLPPSPWFGKVQAPGVITDLAGSQATSRVTQESWPFLPVSFLHGCTWMHHVLFYCSEPHCPTRPTPLFSKILIVPQPPGSKKSFHKKLGSVKFT